MFHTDKSGHTEMSNFLDAPELLELLQQLRLVYLEGQVKLIKTDSAQHSSNKCKKYLPKNYS